ncbi:MAG: CHASE4 domain-containing protein [Chloroflexota bacterium]
MTLRKKTFLMLGVTLISLFGVLFVISRVIVLGGFADQEKQDTHRSVERVLSALDNDLFTLDTTTRDWASWDDTYDFIQNGDEDYIESNLGDPTFITLRLNLMQYIDALGNIVFEKAYDLNEERQIPIPEGLHQHLSTDDILLNHLELDSSATGLLSLPEGPMLVASLPILTSEDQGPIRGTLIFGRFLNTTEVQRLAQTTFYSLVAHELRDPQMPPDFQVALSSLSEESPIFARTLTSQTVAGYALLQDIYDEPVLVLRADIPRDIYARGRTTVNFFMGALLTAVLVFGVVILLLLDRLVLSRLARLSADVNHISASSNPTARVSVAGRDELSDLGSTINGMLGALERSQAEYKRVEEDMAHQAQELARSNTELEHFAYVTSHDLQEPLRMVASYTQLLARRYKGQLDTDADEFIAYAVNGVTRMQALINDLLAYSRVNSKGNPFGPIDCSFVVDQVLSNLQEAIRDSSAVVTHDALPTVLGDSMQLTQLFQNLVGNAIKFHGENPPRVHLSAERKGKEWLFSIRDNGIGIDPQYAERIFLLFQRLHSRNEYPGTGIGLTVCKRIVERHGGSIWVDSEPGKGSTFCFTIPTEGDREP